MSSPTKSGSHSGLRPVVQDLDLEAARHWLHAILEPHLDARGVDFLASAAKCDLAQLGPQVARASRFARSRPLNASGEACCKASGIRLGWVPERWQVLETLRIAMLLDRNDLQSSAFEAAYLGLFPYADEGELRALYRALALIPGAQRFAWQAGEGCRTNVLGVFEAVACDSPFPAAHFDDVAWRSMCVKALFMGSPLWRISGLDDRLTPELARIALDLVEERRSAGRQIPADLWLLIGAHGVNHGGPRGIASLQTEWDGRAPGTRDVVALALARCGALDSLKALSAQNSDALALDKALAGTIDQSQWATPHSPQG